MKVPSLSVVLVAFTLHGALRYAEAKGHPPTQCHVRGIVADSSAASGNTSVLLDSGTPAGWEDFIAYTEVDAAGAFDAHTPCGIRGRRLYVASGPLFSHLTPLAPPYNRDNKLGASFAGMSVPDRRDVDLGEVVIQVRHRTVSVRLLTPDETPLLATDADWHRFWYRLSNDQGVWASEGGLSIKDRQDSVSVAASEITMVMPDGRWILEINRDSGRGKWLRPSEVLEVKPDSAAEPVRLHYEVP